jgi:hypothetical protein
MAAGQSDEISGFSDVAAYLERTGRARMSAPGDAVRVRFEDTVVELSTAATPGGGTWLAIAVPVCALKRLRLRPALAANLDLPIGAFAVTRADVVLRQTLPLDGLRHEQLERCLRGMSGAARRLRAAARAADDAAEVPLAYLFR